MTNESLLAVPPLDLTATRMACHRAVQWPSRAARANLSALPDDSHSNLGWDDATQALVSHPLDREGRHRLGFGFTDGALIALVGAEVAASLPLAEADESFVGRWCDEQLRSVGLEGATEVELPYTLEPADYSALVDTTPLSALGAWYASGQAALANIIERFAGRAVDVPRARCWPHHFDIAALFPLDAGDPETARSIGVGMSPGDESYAQPYFYCTPWPTPPSLPAAPAPFAWHTAGFTSLVLTAETIDAATDLDAAITAAFTTAADALG